MEQLEQKVFGIITARRLTKPLVTLFGLLALTIGIVIYLAAVAAFKKLDDGTIYNIDVNSEAFEFVTTTNTPDILLQRFTPLLHSCKSMQEKAVYEGAIIKLKPDVSVLIERKSTGILKLTAVSMNEEAASVGSLLGQFENCKLGENAVFQVQLDKDNPVFSMNVSGDLQVGRTLSDATDDYYPLVKSGQVVIQDKTAFSKSPLTLSPQFVRPGDTLLLTQAKGIVRAQLDASGFIGVFTQQGNSVQIMHLYGKEAESISPSFIDRVISDSELAFALSVLVVFIQFVGFGISTLFRLAMFSESVSGPEEKWKDRKWRKTQ